MRMTARGSASLITLAAAVILFSGCASLPGSSPENSASTGADARRRAIEAVPSPSATDTGRDGRAPADLSFETGVDLDPAEWRVQWFNFGGGLSELTPDDGNGNWSLIDDASQCELHFYQGTIAGLDYGQEDRSVSDDLLWIFIDAIFEDATREDVANHAFDDGVPLFDGSGILPMRTIWGTSMDEGTWLYTARMFGSLGGGVSLDIRCPPGQDASAVYTKLRDADSLVVDVGPGSS